ncbi:MAG: hypothetical protein IKW18_02300 [Clostridia bacterium]|nr:hypothetical protein [Clostridia bacterium]
MTQLILAVLFFLIVTISALVGLIRGMNKTIIRLITFAGAMILSFCISAPLTRLLANKILLEGQTLGEILLESVRSEEMIAGILDEAPLLEEAILVSPAFVMAILVFPIVFFLCSFISWIVFLCVKKPLSRVMFKETFEKRQKNKESMDAVRVAQAVSHPEAIVMSGAAKAVSDQASSRKTEPSFGVRFGKRMAGMGIGAVIGVLIFGMIFAPILGIFSVLPENSALNEAIDTMVAQKILEIDLAEIVKNELLVRDGALFKIYGVIGITFAGKTYLSAVSRIESAGLKTNIPAEFDAVFSVVQTAIEGGLLKAALNSEKQNELFIVLSNQSFVDELMQNMLKSKLFRTAVPKITALATESVAKSLGVPADKNAVYDNMMDNIAVAVKESDINYELIKAYEDSLVATDYTDFVSEDEIEIPTVPTQEEYEAEKAKIASLAEKISKIINTSVAGSTESVANSIAEQIVQHIQSRVTQSGEEMIQNFNADDVKATVSAVSEANAVSEEAPLNKILKKLNDPERFETNIATVETITAAIFSSVADAVSDERKADETAITLANVVSNFAGAVSEAIDENGQMDIAKIDFEQIAEAVTTLQNSNLKEVGSSVLDIVICGELGENEMISTAMLAVKESYDNGDNISGTINSTGALIVLGTTMSNGSTAAENIAESFASLVKNLDETTMKLLPSILSNETLATMGVAEKHRELAYNAVESLLRELMALKGSDRYEHESDIILAVYDIFSNGKNNLKEQIPALVDKALQSDALLNTLNKIAVEALNPEMLISFGISEEAAPRAYDIFKTFLNEVKIGRQNGDYAYEHESVAIKFIYDLAKTGINNITAEDIQKLAEAAVNSNAVYNTLTGISESNPFGLKINNEETRANLICDIESAFAASAKTEKDIAVFNAIARIFGLEDEVDFT